MQTRGEYLVGIDFNPSGNTDVDEIKALAAQLIDKIEAAADNKIDATTDDVAQVQRLKALAITSAEEAAMWGVKMATKRGWL